MGYSRSKKTIERVRPVLDSIIAIRQEGEITVPSKTPHKLCYAIRDALAVIRSLPESSADKKYLAISERYKIRVKSDSVIFEPRETVSFADPILALVESKADKLQIADAVSLIEVVGAVVKHKVDTMQFPNARLAEGDFDRLSRWASLNHYEVTEIKPLTLSKHGPSNSENRAAKQG